MSFSNWPNGQCLARAIVLASVLLGTACGAPTTAIQEAQTTERVVLGPKTVSALCDGSLVWSGGQDSALLTSALTACPGTVNIRYSGPIDTETVELLRQIPNHEELPQGQIIFFDLNSGGGTVQEAMDAGHAVWDKMIIVQIPANAECLSACVFVLAGARIRGIDGRVGIHRVFTPDPSITTPAELRAASAEFDSSARGYFQEFGVSAGIVDMMMSTSSATMRYLSPDELEQLGLGGINVSLRELTRLNAVRRCGADYEQRMREAEIEWNRRCPANVAATRSRIGAIAAAEMRRLEECKAVVDREYGVSNPAECR